MMAFLLQSLIFNIKPLNIQYKTFMPQAQFVMFEQSGHNPYLEEPEKFYALFNTFFGIK